MFVCHAIKPGISSLKNKFLGKVLLRSFEKNFGNHINLKVEKLSYGEERYYFQTLSGVLGIQ